MTSPKRTPDIQAAIDALDQGTPLGEVIRLLKRINESNVIESYRSGLSLDGCAILHGLLNKQQAHVLIKQYAPHLMRQMHRYRRKTGEAVASHSESR